MEHKEVGKNAATAENCMFNFILPGMTTEIMDKSYEVIKAFAQLQEATDRTGDTVAIDSMMCVLIDMAVFRAEEIEEIDITRMQTVKNTWLAACGYLRHPQCGGCRGD